MSQVRSFPYIPVKVNRHKILKRMGYHSRKIEISEGMLDEVDGFIETASDLIELKALCFRTGIESELSSGQVRISGSTMTFKSDKLYRFLAGADQILMMGITGGTAVAEQIKMLQEQGRMTAAVVIDAAASGIVDDGFDWLAALYSKELVREGRRLSARRFSAGYGDFDIKFQRDIYSLLGLGQLGIEITDSCMLVPEKTVTAIYGIYGE